MMKGWVSCSGTVAGVRPIGHRRNRKAKGFDLLQWGEAQYQAAETRDNLCGSVAMLQMSLSRTPVPEIPSLDRFASPRLLNSGMARRYRGASDMGRQNV